MYLDFLSIVTKEIGELNGDRNMSSYQENLWCPSCSAWTSHNHTISYIKIGDRSVQMVTLECLNCGRETESPGDLR